jgi:hypothetical protein
LKYHPSERLAEIAYESSVQNADRLSQSLDSLRERAAVVFTGAVLATTFFGSQAINGELTTLSWCALGCFIFVTAASLALLQPVKGWNFGLDPDGLLKVTDHMEKGAALTDSLILRGAAISLSMQLNETNYKIGRLVWAFRFACVALCAEIIFWTVDLAGR